MGRSVSERILELEKDPKKKEALDKARAKIKLWREDGTLNDHFEIEELVIYSDKDGKIYGTESTST